MATSSRSRSARWVCWSTRSRQRTRKAGIMAVLQSRLPLPDVAAFTPEQQAIHDSIMATRGNLNGPFLAWMHSPKMASLAEKLGAFCRYDTQLALVESELLILCVAGRFQCVG